MKKINIRIFTVLFAVFLCITIFPATAFADDGAGPRQDGVRRRRSGRRLRERHVQRRGRAIAGVLLR